MENKTTANMKNSLQDVHDVLGYMRSVSKNETIARLEKDKIFFSDWTEYWLMNFCGNLKINTAFYYKSTTNNHINRVLGHLLLKDLKAEDVQLFINSLVLGVGTEKPLSAKSVQNIHGVLHKCLAAAVKYEYISENPADQIILPGVQFKNINVMDNDMLYRFFSAIKGTEKEAAYIVSLFTGMRVSELIGLTWDCIDFKEGSIFLYRQLVLDRESKKFVFTSLKNNKKRMIYPAACVMTILQKLKETVPETAENFVFVNRRINSHYTIPSLYSTFKRTVKKLGYPNLRYHDLRHTYAVLSLQAGDDIKSLQANLGHHSSAFTLDVYGHLTQDMQRNSAKKMSDYIQKCFPDVNRQIK